MNSENEQKRLEDKTKPVILRKDKPLSENEEIYSEHSRKQLTFEPEHPVNHVLQIEHDEDGGYVIQRDYDWFDFDYNREGEDYEHLKTHVSGASFYSIFFSGEDIVEGATKLCMHLAQTSKRRRPILTFRFIDVPEKDKELFKAIFDLYTCKPNVYDFYNGRRE